MYQISAVFSKAVKKLLGLAFTLPFCVMQLMAIPVHQKEAILIWILIMAKMCHVLVVILCHFGDFSPIYWCRFSTNHIL